MISIRLTIKSFIAALCTGFICASLHAQQPQQEVPLPFELKKIDGSQLLAKYYKKVDEIKLLGVKDKVVGQIVGLFYHAPADTVPSEILNTYVADLESKGFQKLYESAGNGGVYLSSSFCNQSNNHWCGSDFGSQDEKVVTLKKSAGDGVTYISIGAGHHLSISNWNKGRSEYTLVDAMPFQKDDNVIVLNIVLPKITSIAMVKEDVNLIRDSLNSKGFIDLYGLYFDFNKTELKPESEPTVSEIAKVLLSDPNLVLGVVGHTDNVGSAEYNQTLSEGRAQSVVNELVQKYRIDNKRLIASGMGASKPVSSNDTDEGRAKNRRVELVKRNP